MGLIEERRSIKAIRCWLPKGF